MRQTGGTADGSDDPEPEAGEVVDEAIRRLFGRDTAYVALWGVQIVAAALVTPFLTRLLDVSAFGVVAAANAVMQVTFVLCGLGLEPALQRQFATGADPRDPHRLVSVSLVISAATAVVVAASAPMWMGVAGFEQPAPVLLAVLWAGLSAGTNTALALLRSQDRLVAFSFVSLAQSVVAEATSLVLVSVVEPTATMFVLGQVLAQTLALVMALVWAPPRGVRRRDAPMVRRAFAFGAPLVPAVLSVLVLNASDRLIIQSELGSPAVARYQVAYNVGSLPMLLLGVLNSSWMPRIFSFTVEQERAAVLAASRDLLYRLLIPALVGLAAGAPFVLRVWAPPEYLPDTLLLVNAVILISAIPYTAGLSSTRALMAEGRTRYLAGCQMTAAGLNVALNLLLLPRFGLVGSAAATALSLATLALLLSHRVRRVTTSVSSPPHLVLALGGTAAFVVGLAFAPTTSWWLLRSLLVLVTLVWFTRDFLTAQGRRRG